MVKEHEGFDPPVANSHTGVITRVFTETMRASIEAYVATDATSLNPEPLARAALNTAANESHRITDLSEANPYHTNCVFNYAPNVRIR